MIAWLAVVLGINSTRNAGNFTRRTTATMLLILYTCILLSFFNEEGGEMDNSAHTHAYTCVLVAAAIFFLELVERMATSSSVVSTREITDAPAKASSTSYLQVS